MFNIDYDNVMIIIQTYTIDYFFFLSIVFIFFSFCAFVLSFTLTFQIVCLVFKNSPKIAVFGIYENLKYRFIEIIGIQLHFNH